MTRKVTRNTRPSFLHVHVQGRGGSGHETRLFLGGVLQVFSLKVLSVLALSQRISREKIEAELGIVYIMM